MKKLLRMWRSFHKNIIVKRKFKSYWTSFVDSGYRAEINRLFDLTKNSTRTEMRLVPTSLLVHGHRIIYPEYTLSLMLDDTTPLEPIKVVEHDGVFVVIDGNHRLPAIIARAARLKTEFTQCEVIL